MEWRCALDRTQSIGKGGLFWGETICVIGIGPGGLDHMTLKRLWRL